MFSQIISITRRAPDSVLVDSIGCAAVVVLVYVGFSLPGLI